MTMATLKKKLFTVMIITLIYTVSSTGLHAWELVRGSRGIMVYTRKVNDSNIKEFKGITNIKTSLPSLLALMDDTSSYPSWMHACKSARLLKKISAKDRYYHIINDYPWPFTNRDMIIRSVISENPTTEAFTFQISNAADFIPAKRGLIRVKNLRGLWRFTPLKNGSTRVLYQFFLDPGGNLPGWLINSAVLDYPYNTLLKMKNVVKQQKYQKTKYEIN